jgi:hypothetical protein
VNVWLLYFLCVFMWASYGRAVYIVLTKWGFDETNWDVIRWNIEDQPVTITLYLLGCLLFAIPVTLGTALSLPLWIIGKTLGLLIGDKQQ